VGAVDAGEVDEPEVVSELQRHAVAASDVDDASPLLRLEVLHHRSHRVEKPRSRDEKRIPQVVVNPWFSQEARVGVRAP
jgi:hypothetical protein